MLGRRWLVVRTVHVVGIAVGVLVLGVLALGVVVVFNGSVVHVAIFESPISIVFSFVVYSS